MLQVLINADTLGVATGAAPADVAREQLDSALVAELAIPASSSRAAPPRWGPAVVPSILFVLLGALLLVRARERVRGARRDAAHESDQGMEAAGAAGEERVSRLRPPRPAPRLVPLPPHVAAILARVEAERRAAAAQGATPARARASDGGAEREAEPAAERVASRPSPAAARRRRGLDLLIDH